LCALSTDGKHFQLELTVANKVFGTHSPGAPFNVYLRNLTKQPGMQAATCTVKAGDTLKPTFALDQFKNGTSKSKSWPPTVSTAALSVAPTKPRPSLSLHSSSATASPPAY
jgi:hypothetical protein